MEKIELLPYEILLEIITFSLNENEILSWGSSHQRFYYLDLGILRLVTRKWNEMICDTSYLWRHVFLASNFINHIKKSFDEDRDPFCIQMSKRCKLTLHIVYCDELYIARILKKYMPRFETIFFQHTVNKDYKLRIFKYMECHPNSVRNIVCYNGIYYDDDRGDDKKSRSIYGDDDNGSPPSVPSIENFYCDFEEKIFELIDFRNLKTLTMVNCVDDCRKLLEGLRACEKLTHLKLEFAHIKNDSYDTLPCITLGNLEYMHFNIEYYIVNVQDTKNKYGFKKYIDSHFILNQIKIPNVKMLYIGYFTSSYEIPECKVESLHISSRYFKYEHFERFYSEMEKYKNTLKTVTLECQYIPSLFFNDEDDEWIRCTICYIPPPTFISLNDIRLSVIESVESNKFILNRIKRDLLNLGICQRVYTKKCIYCRND